MAVSNRCHCESSDADDNVSLHGAGAVSLSLFSESSASLDVITSTAVDADSYGIQCSRWHVGT